MMPREEIIKQLKPYFDVKELVCNHIYSRFGEQSWMFLSTQLLHVLLCLRTDILRMPMHINTGNMHQRGMRCNLCPIVKSKKSVYVSAHTTGNAVDFTCDDKTAEEVREIIKAKPLLLPCKVRLEDGVSWVHIDVYDDGTEDKITTFKA